MGKKRIGGKHVDAASAGDDTGNGTNTTGSSGKLSAALETHAPADEYGWRSYPIVAETRRDFRNPLGRDVTIKAELRSPEGKPFLRYAVGRVDAKSPIGLARQGFYEDLPYAIEALIALYEKGREAYVESESVRIRHNLERDLDRVEAIASHDTQSWRGTLQKLRSQLLDRLPGSDDVS